MDFKKFIYLFTWGLTSLSTTWSSHDWKGGDGIEPLVKCFLFTMALKSKIAPGGLHCNAMYYLTGRKQVPSTKDLNFLHTA